MTFARAGFAADQSAQARRVNTGVRRLAGESGAPVVLLPGASAAVCDAVAPLLARRRDVYVLTNGEGASARSLADTISNAFGVLPVALIGSNACLEIAELCPVEAVAITGDRSSGTERGSHFPVLRTDSGCHPVEAAHRIDSFLRNPRLPVSVTLGEGPFQAPRTMPPDHRATTVNEVDTIIVGSGFAGLGLAVRMQREGRRSFLVLERADDVGGTWRDNVYPGVACDIPSHLYSFSFRPKADWSRRYAPGKEILQYLRDSARDEGILPKIRFGNEVTAMRWDEPAHRWRVATTAGMFSARTAVVATGRLSTKRVPTIPGLEDFTGSVFHSSEWPDDLDLGGQRVGLVGTGASAVQILPEIAARAAHVVVFQRSAPYVVPRHDVEYDPADRRALAANPRALQALRHDLFWDAEAGFTARIQATAALSRLRSTALAHLHSQITDPDLLAALTPDYEIGCKRVLLSDDYYPAITSPNVELEASPLVRAGPRELTAGSGRRHVVDALILATGFASTEPPIARRVFGRGGQQLAGTWTGGMRAYHSTAISGFPNLFVIDGPNASLGHNSAVHMIETQIGFVLEALAYLDHASTIEPTLRAQDAYVTELDRRAAATVWTTGGCNSWYVDGRSHRLTLLWPDTAAAFREEAGRFDPNDFLVRMADE